MDPEFQKKIDEQVRKFKESIDKDVKIRTFKDELVKKSIKSWKLQLLEKDKELIKNQMLIRELETKIKKQDEIMEEMNLKINEHNENITQKTSGKIKKIKNYGYGKSKDQKDTE